MYVLGKIYTEREGLERCLKSWMLRTKTAMMMKTSEELHPYIRLRQRQTSDEARGYTCSHGCSMACWRLE